MADLLLERAGEVAAIERAVRLARAGRAPQLVVIGPAGSGRTSVLAHARRCAADHELTILHAEGLEHERDFPFALRGACSASRSSPSRGLRHAARAQSGDSRRAPALIAVDARSNAMPSRATGWCSRRVGSTASGSRWCSSATPAGLRGEPSSFPLRPFSERAVATALHLQLGHTVDPAFARACHAATLGHPLLVCELAAAALRWPGTCRRRAIRRRPLLFSAFSARCPGSPPWPTPWRSSTRGHRVHGAATLAGLGPGRGRRPRPTRLPRGGAAGRRRRAGHRPPAPGPRDVRGHPTGPPWALACPRRAGRRAVRPAPFTTCCAADRRGGSVGPGDPRRRRTTARSPDGRPDAAAELLCRAVREGAGDRGALLVALAEAQRQAHRRVPRSSSSKRPSAEGAPHRSTTSALARALLVHGRTADALALDGADPVELHAGARLLPGHGGAVAARLAIVCAREAEQQRALASPRRGGLRRRQRQAAVALASRALADDALDPESPAYSSPAPRSRGRTGSRRPVCTSSARWPCPTGSGRSAGWCAPGGPRDRGAPRGRR